MVCFLALLSMGAGARRTREHAVSVIPAEMRQAAQAHAAHGCDTELWEHVYRKRRLLVIEPCVRLTGTIQFMKTEPDGDEHIRLRLAAPDQALLNDLNRSRQRGALVLETVCESEPTQRTALGICRQFHSLVPLPRRGSRVTVLGPYVLDKEHGWMEIHPVTSITVEE